jgi:glycosyltransferase involved in cell wall biosynthesis
MKILHVNKFYYPKRGADRVFFNVTKLLEEHGNTVIPFSMTHPKNLKSKYKDYFVSQVNFDNPTSIIEKLRVLGRMLYSFEAKRKVGQLLDSEPCQIAHLENIYHHISPSILGTIKKRGMPIVMTVHDLKLMCPNFKMYTQDAICERCFKHKYYNAVAHKCVKGSAVNSIPAMIEMYFHKVMRFYERYVDVFLSPSEFMKNKMIQWGFDASKIHVLSNFVDTEFFTPGNKDNGYFFYSGGLEPEKGIVTILKAVKRSPSLKVVLSGAGSLESYCKEFIEKHNLQNQIILTGFIEREQTKKYFQECTGTLLMSELYENNPLGVLESIASAKPVIGTDIGGIPELIQDDETGIIIRPGDHIALADAMESLLRDTTKAAQMGKKAHKKADFYGANHYYQELIKVYESLLKG